MTAWFTRTNEPVVVNTDFGTHKKGDTDVTFRYIPVPGRPINLLDPSSDDLLVILRDAKGSAIPMKFLDYVKVDNA